MRDVADVTTVGERARRSKRRCLLFRRLQHFLAI